MPIDGSGNFTRVHNWVSDKAGGIKVVASRMDGEFDNYASALNQAFWRNGIVGMTGALNMGNNAVTAVSDGTNSSPALRFNSDPTTGIFVPAYGKLGLSAGGTERLRVDSGGARIIGGQFVTLGTPVSANPGKFFSNANARPTALGNHDDIATAFTGDLTKSVFQIEQRTSGDALGTPTTGYLYTPETAGIYLHMQNTSGWNQSTSGNEGRTGGVGIRVKGEQYGQGDYVTFNGSMLVSGTRAGSTHVLANPAGSLFNGDMQAGANGVYLNPRELYLKDMGYDINCIGDVVNMERTNGTGAKSAVWIGYIVQNKGTQAIDSVIGANGKFKNYIDAAVTPVDLGTNQSLISAKANQRIYLNNYSTNNMYTNGYNGDYITYSSAISGILMSVGGSGVFQLTGSQMLFNGIPVIAASARFGTSPGTSYPFNVGGSGGSVLGTLGSRSDISNLSTAAGGNRVNVDTYAYRAAAGSDWTTVESRIQHRVDSTGQAFIAFNPNGGTNGAAGIGFATGSGSPVERVRIDSSGRVGIGTQSPSQPLDVNGQSWLRSTVVLGTAGTQNIATDANGTYLRATSHGFQDVTGVTTRMHIDSAGNVGIGTNAPAHLLDVFANGGLNRIQATSDGGVEITRAGGGSYIDLKALTASDYDVRLATSGTGSSADLTFLLGGASEKLRLKATGAIVSADLVDAPGYKGLPQNAQGGAYTLVMADQGKSVYCTGAAAAVTIPPNSSVAFPIGTAITIVNDGSGARTITQGAGVTLKLAGSGTTGNRNLVVGGLATLIKVATDTWFISGAGVT